MTLNRSRSARLLTACLAVGLLAAGASRALADYRLVVLHVSDLQSRLDPVTGSGAACAPADRGHCYGGAAHLAARIHAERATGGNVVVVNAGNALTGSPFYDQYKQRAISDTLNLMGFDAMTVGERDFIDGTGMLSQFQANARFPLLGANIDVQSDPAMRDRIYPFLATTVGGEPVALIGYSTEQLIALAKPTGVIHVQPIETALKRWMAQIEMMGINKVIAISHAGHERDREIAATIPGIDAIVSAAPDPAGGKLARYLTVHKGPGGQPVIMVQSDAYGRSLGRLELTFDGRGVPTRWSGDAIEITDASAEDPTVKAFVGQLAAPLANQAVADRVLVQQPPR